MKGSEHIFSFSFPPHLVVYYQSLLHKFRYFIVVQFSQDMAHIFVKSK